MEDVPYGRILREGWLIIVIVALLGALAAYGATRVMPKTYAATSTLIMRVNSTPITLYESNQFVLARIQSYPALIDSPEVISGVRSDLGLSESEYSDSAIRKMLTATNPTSTALLVVEADAPTAKMSAGMADSAAQHLSALVGETENTTDTKVNVRLDVVIPAVEPASAVSPQTLAFTGLGLIAGLALGAIIAVYRTTTNRRVRSIPDVRKASKLPLVGRIPRHSRIGSKNAAIARNAAFDDTIGNLAVLGGHDIEVYAFVGASSGSFETSMLEGLIDSYAEAGARACAIVVRPDHGSHSEHGSAAHVVAISEVGEPIGDAEADSAQKRKHAVFVVTTSAGSAEFGPALLDACARLRAQYDIVLIAVDNAASGIVEQLASINAGVVIAVRHNSTTATQLSALVTHMHVLGISPIGVLMTHAAPSDVSPIADTWRPSDRQEVHAVVNPAVGDGGSGR